MTEKWWEEVCCLDCGNRIAWTKSSEPRPWMVCDECHEKEASKEGYTSHE